MISVSRAAAFSLLQLEVFFASNTTYIITLNTVRIKLPALKAQCIVNRIFNWRTDAASDIILKVVVAGEAFGVVATETTQTK